MTRRTPARESAAARDPYGLGPARPYVAPAIALLALAGCATTPQAPAPVVDVAGPRLPRTQFTCGRDPVPPDPTRSTAKSAARHENEVRAWGRGCAAKLEGAGLALEAAGQLVGSE